MGGEAAGGGDKNKGLGRGRGRKGVAGQTTSGTGVATARDGGFLEAITPDFKIGPAGGLAKVAALLSGIGTIPAIAAGFVGDVVDRVTDAPRVDLLGAAQTLLGDAPMTSGTGPPPGPARSRAVTAVAEAAPSAPTQPPRRRGGNGRQVAQTPPLLPRVATTAPAASPTPTTASSALAQRQRDEQARQRARRASSFEFASNTLLGV